LQCVAVRCSALQCVAVRRSVLQCATVNCNALQCVAVCCNTVRHGASHLFALQKALSSSRITNRGLLFSAACEERLVKKSRASRNELYAVSKSAASCTWGKQSNSEETQRHATLTKSCTLRPNVPRLAPAVVQMWIEGVHLYVYIDRGTNSVKQMYIENVHLYR